MEGQRLSVVLQRLLLLAEIGVHPADVVERRGFPGPIPHGAMEGQRLGEYSNAFCFSPRASYTPPMLLSVVASPARSPTARWRASA
jgi:hypothetical protein